MEGNKGRNTRGIAVIDTREDGAYITDNAISAHAILAKIKHQLGVEEDADNGIGEVRNHLA